MWDWGIIEVAAPDGSGNIKVNYEVKHYGKGSQFGIRGGKISKLEMRVNDKPVAHYCRGWDLRPNKSDKAIMTAYREILKKYN